jgi:hypothetical protein
MEHSESKRKGDTAAKQEPENFEDFDYYWQHLRRNGNYISTSSDIRRNSKFARQLLRDSRHELDRQRQVFRASCLLPTPVRANIKNSEEALREVLETKPDFFQTAQWQTIKAKATAAEPVAYWNELGPDRGAWRGYYDDEKDQDKTWKQVPTHLQFQNATSPKRRSRRLRGLRQDPQQSEGHDVAGEFLRLKHNLEIAEQGVTSHGGILEYWTLQQQGRTVEEDWKQKQAEHEEARTKMRRFLEAHPRMDFVADTRLPWATVSRALEAEWDQVKDLRRRVGLEANEHPPRKRQWKEQLEVYDAYLPHWQENRKKFAVLHRIWRENLGFQDALKLLGVELTPEAIDLASLLDRKELKPKRFFIFTDSYLRHNETASYMEAATRGLPERAKPKHGSGAPGIFDDQGQPVAENEFDDDAVDALLAGDDGRGVELGSSSEWAEAALNTLQSWRPHFSIPIPPLPPTVARIRPDTRREWFNSARKRIESLWPITDAFSPS